MATQRPVLRPAIAAAWVFAALGPAAAPSVAIDAAGIHIDRITKGPLSARDIDVRIEFPDSKSSRAAISAARVDLGPQLGELHYVQIDCAHPVLRPPLYSCGDAVLRFRSARFGAQSIRAGVTWNNESESLEFSARDIRIAGGSLKIIGRWSKREWTLAVDAGSLQLADLRRQLGKSSPLPESWSLDGKLASAHLELGGRADLQRIDMDATLTDANLANPDGTTATAGFGSHAIFSGRRNRDDWQFAASVDAARGEILAGRWYWNFGRQPASVTANGIRRADGSVRLAQSTVRLGVMLSAELAGELKPFGQPALSAMQISLSDFDLAALPPQTRDGALAGTIVSQLQGSGHFHGVLNIEDNLPAAVDLQLIDVTVEDKNAKLAISGLDGHFAWRSLARTKQLLAAGGAADRGSRLAWRGGLLYGMTIGGAAVEFEAAGADMRLGAPVRIPILDGGLAVRTLQLRRIGEPGMSIRFDSTLDPISVPLLCKAFGWPEFAGKLSGRVPDLALENGVLTLGGALQASVFDGDVSVRNLRLSDSFGARPRLQADISFDRLDLAAVTGAFSFGKITGRLSGRIDELELVGWQPVAFDASLYSTPKDRSRKRISQRAVQNISSIGGGTGAAAALQRGFLRFFDEFSYSKLGLSCKLVNDVCLMEGIEPRANGYYLVKGSGLPRIDVIGDSHRIDWPRLVETLKQLPESQAAVGKPP